jgi:hypothetical protein
MDIADKFQKIGLFLAENGFVAILKKLAMATVPMIESDGITGEKPPHDRGDGSGARSQQEVEMIRHERPGKTGSGGIEKNLAEPFQKADTVSIILENAFSLDSSTDYMMQGTRSIYASFARHVWKITTDIEKRNL